jgi:hypothetical protein
MTYMLPPWAQWSQFTPYPPPWRPDLVATILASSASRQAAVASARRQPNPNCEPFRQPPAPLVSLPSGRHLPMGLWGKP